MRNRAWRRYIKDKFFKDRIKRSIMRGGYYNNQTFKSVLCEQYIYRLKTEKSRLSYGWGYENKNNKRSILKMELYKELKYAEFF